MRLSFLGGAQEVGKSSIFLESDGVKAMLDAGIRVHDSNEVPPIEKTNPNAVIISHAHLDHCGSLPVLFKNRPVHALATFPTIPIINLLIEDSEKIALSTRKSLPYGRQDVKRMNDHLTPLPYNTEYEFYNGMTVEMLDAGHILGSAMALIKNGKKLLYTGDFNTAKTKLHEPAKPPKENVDALVIESTYALREHDDRKKTEKEFVKSVKESLEEGQTVLIPAFAVGRTQEMLVILDSAGVKDIFVDGMGRQVLDIMAEYSSYVSDYKNLAKAVRNAEIVATHADRRKAMKNPSVIISTAGMLDGGPALSYLKEMHEKKNGVVLLTGFQVPGTNGSSLVKGEKVRLNGHSEKISLPFKHFDFSAHSGKKQLYEFVKQVNPSKVYCVHGDEPSCLAFAEGLKQEGFNAVAPRVGEHFNV